jgi:hypothetical protein
MNSTGGFPTFLVLRRLALSAILSLSSACGSFQFASSTFVPQAPETADYPDTGAVVLEDIATLEYRAVGSGTGAQSGLVAVLDHHRRIKILQPSGLSAATVELPIDGYSTIRRVIARSIGPTGEIHEMPSWGLKTFARADPAERSADTKTLSFTVPAASVGGVVEYRYERLYVDPFLVPPYVFADRMPILRSEFGLRVDDAIKVDFRYGRGDRLVDRPPMQRDDSHKTRTLLFIETDLPPLFAEPLMPHPSRLSPWVATMLREDKSGQTDLRVENWADVGAMVLGRMNQVQGPEGRGTLTQRYHAVQKVLHPMAADGLGVRMPQSLQALVKGTPACSRDATGLCLGALHGKSTEASAALVANDAAPMAHNDFPALYPFTRAVVALRVTEDMLARQLCGADLLSHTTLCGAQVGDLVYADPSCPTCALGVLPARLMGGRALVISAQRAEWRKMPLDPPNHHLVRGKLRLRLDVDGSVSGALEASLTGHPAASLRAALISAGDAAADGAGPGAAETLCRAAILGTPPASPLASSAVQPSGLPPLALTGVKPLNLQELEAPLRVQAHLVAHLHREDYENFRLPIAAILGPSLPKAWQTTRRTKALLDGPRWQEMGAEISLPAGYQVKLPPPLKLSTEFAEYAAGFALRNHTLSLSRRLVLKVHAIPAEKWLSFQDFLAAIAEYEQTGPKVFSPAT